MEVKHSRVILLMDGDSSGIEGMKRLQKRFVYTPCDYYWITEPGLKDITEMYKSWGEQETIDYLIELLQ